MSLSNRKAFLPRLARPVIQVLALSVVLIASGHASAQGFFGLFGDNRTRTAPPSTPALSYANTSSSPFASLSNPTPAPAATAAVAAPMTGGGRVVAYCVRLCDGRFFPLENIGDATPVQLCSAFCPSAQTRIFTGSEIGSASASNGEPYSRLANAFRYRKEIVSGCTCNGRDAFGLARVDVAKDPTLRPGDIVASGNSARKLSGAQVRRTSALPATTGEATSQRRPVATALATPN